MILPNVRASFGEEETRWLIRLLSGGDPDRADHWEAVLAEKGMDRLLDDPRTLEALLEREGVEVLPSRLVLYVILRRSLLERGVESRTIADYVTALVHEFGLGRRARRISGHGEREYGYLVDILEELTRAEGRRAFLLKAHLGNFALWLSGLFPDYITERVRRRGGPGMKYYEEMGQTGFWMAADARHAQERSLDDVYRDAAESFGPLRQSLNRVSDRFLFPRSGTPVERLIRQARNGHAGGEGPH